MAASKAAGMLDSLGLYQNISGLVLGFHGCDKAVGEQILKNPNKHIASSDNAWDWLGGGIYFWENDPKRALEFAEMKQKYPGVSKTPIKNPFVIGAVIDLGLCCNLLDRTALAEVKKSYSLLSQVYSAGEVAMPKNEGNEGVWRHLDCAVMENMHLLRKDANLPKYDTVRGLFWEGAELYPNSGMKSKNHVQIAVRSTARIRGYFRPFA
jgi:hypothetical protein